MWRRRCNGAPRAVVLQRSVTRLLADEVRLLDARKPLRQVCRTRCLLRSCSGGFHVDNAHAGARLTGTSARWCLRR
jgi:hypothetical protein